MSQTMRLGEVILYVQQMPAQVSFYCDVLGLSLAFPSTRSEAEEAFWVTFDTGACQLCLHGGGDGNFGADAPKFVFMVEDLPAARGALVVKGVPCSEPHSPAPGVLVCDCVDPEGNRFSLEAHM